MSFRHGVLLSLALLAPAAARAQDTPEQLLSAKSQFYLRWDGLKAHEEAYARTALGKMLAGDTGKLIKNLYNLGRDNLSAALTAQGLLQGAPPEKVQKIQKEITEAVKVLSVVGDHGLILCAEVRSGLPPDGQVTLIVPNVAAEAKPLLAALSLSFTLGGLEVKQNKAMGRTFYTVDVGGPVNVGWWLEGKHFVLAASTEKIDAACKRMTEGKHDRLTSSPLYKQVTAFKDFPTNSRGFLDVDAYVKMAMLYGKEVKEVVEAVGLDSVKAITFQSGFDDEAERGVLEIRWAGQRKGLLAVMAGKPFKLGDVPALPTDVISWSMGSIDLAAVYDGALKAVDGLVKKFAPNEAGQIKAALAKADQALGINIRKDLLGALGDKFLTYNSPAEGIIGLNMTFAIKVKDPKNLLDTLDQAAKGGAALAGVQMVLRKKKYRGVEVREVQINQQGFFFLPTYAVVKGWLVIGYFPQTVQGFILRSQGELPAWKPDAVVARSLAKMPKEFTAVSVSDPRPTVKQVMAAAPLIGALVRSLMPESPFDPSLIPNGHEATKHLFPNVSVTTEDGKTTRFHTRASLSLPFDLVGADTYILAGAGIALFSNQ
jgi:hypothetical protein